MFSMKNPTFMNVNITSNFFGNINKENSFARKNNEQKVKSELHQDLFWTFRILIMFFKLIGLATFTHRIVIYKKRTSYTFQYSKLGIVYNVVLSSLMIVSNYMCIPDILNDDYYEKTKLTVGIEILQTVLGALATCAIFISYCIDQKFLVQIANRLSIIEHEIDRLYDLYYPLRRQRIFYTTIIVCILKICLLILLLFTENLAFHTGPDSWLTDVLPTFHVGWLLIQYFLLVTVIQTDFADINRAIQSLTKINAPDLRLQSLYQTRRIVVNNSTVHQLLQLRDVHCHLCEISEDVSSFYSLPVLFAIIFFFLTLIETTDNIVHDFLNCAIGKETKAELKEFSLQLLHRKIQFTANGYFTLDNTFFHSMEKTGNIVHDLLNCAVGKEIKAELKKFSLQLLHRQIQFTANGYFTLDNTFLHSLTGTVVTYLIILVQFQMVSSRSIDQTAM
ncbi:GR28B protein, partial [Acromyrmex heyeri]